MATGSNRKYAGLEVIRAIAALVVVYNHVFTFDLLPRGLLSLPANYATEAVIVFFVLSGVVITISAERKRVNSTSKLRQTKAFITARFLRIYPIFLLGLLLAVAAERLIEQRWMDVGQFAGNLLFLESMQGFVVGVPRYNMPLWSLSNEMSYYLIFAFCLMWAPLLSVWLIAALISAAALYPPPLSGGIVSHLIFVLAFSLPWIMGHLSARWRERLPKVPVSFGIACLMIGLVFARCPLTREYYDIFRLTAFAICCCPLMLSIIQSEDLPEARFLLVARAALAAIAIALLWTVSPSLLVVKYALSIVAIAAAALPLAWIDKGLASLRWAVPAFVYIGSISYAIYATHAPIIAIVNNLTPAWSTPSKLTLLLLATFGVSHLMERMIQPLFSSRKAAPGGLEAAVVPRLNESSSAPDGMATGTRDGRRSFWFF